MDTPDNAPADVAIAPDGNNPPPVSAPPAGDGAPAASWYDGFSDPLKDYAKTKGFKGPDAALEAYQALETKLGKQSFPEPDLEKLDEWAGWEKLRGGKDPKDYAIKMPEMPEGIEIDNALFDRVLDKAGKYMPEKVAQTLVDTFGAYISEGHQANIEAQNAKVAALNAALDKDWGADREAKTARAQNVFKTLFEGDVDALTSVERLVGEHSTLRLMDRLGDLLGEDKIHIDRDGGSQGASAIQADIDKLRADKEWMGVYRDKNNPLQKSHKAQIDALYAKLPQDREDDD